MSTPRRAARIRRATAAVLGATLLAGSSACGLDDENSSWVFVSQPSAGSEPIQGGLVFGYSKGSSQLLVVRQAGSPSALQGGPQAQGGRIIGLDVTELPASGGLPARRLVLGTETDFALSLVERRALVHGPCFAEGVLRLDDVVTLEIAPDAAGLVELGTTRGERLLLSAWGNLAIHATPAFCRVHVPGAAPRVYAPDTVIETRGEDWFLREAGGRGTVLTPPAAPAPGHQFAFVRGREAIRFFSPRGQVMAELPAQSFDVRDGSEGVLLDGRFPRGVSGALSEPFRALLPLRNRHLLILRGENAGR